MMPALGFGTLFVPTHMGLVNVYMNLYMNV